MIKFAPYRTDWPEIVRRGRFSLRGVRSAEARNNLACMRIGDSVFFCRSQINPAIMGILKVVRTAYPDPTSANPRWLTCDFATVKSFPEPMTLSTIKADPRLHDLAWIRRPRLAVMPVSPEHARILISFLS